jgi:hypothetical protein
MLGGALAFALSGLASQSTAAVDPGVDFKSPGQFVLGNCCWTLGYSFTANADVAAVGLATWDMWEPGDGGQAEVGLWDASGNLLASVTVTDGSPTTGIADWSYTLLASPVALAAGETYYVGSFGPSADYTFQTAGFSVDPRIAFLQDAFVYNPDGLAFPSDWDGFGRLAGGGFLGGNVVLAPEAFTWAMMLIGFAGLGVLTYRASRRSAAAA